MERFIHRHIEYGFERRRYGTCRFFTWLMWRPKGSEPGTPWQSYGDPWPKARLNKQELQEALAIIFLRTLNVGDTVRVQTGAVGQVVSICETRGDEGAGVRVDFPEYGGTYFVNAGGLVEILNRA